MRRVRTAEAMRNTEGANQLSHEGQDHDVSAFGCLQDLQQLYLNTQCFNRPYRYALKWLPVAIATSYSKKENTCTSCTRTL